MVEQIPVKNKVRGSNPRGGADFLNLSFSKKMPYYLSYLMGATKIQDKELQDLGIEIVGKSKSGSRKLQIPATTLIGYSSLIKKKLSKGFWNEVIGSESIKFIFKYKDGKTKEYTLSSYNEAEIGKLFSEFNGDSLDKTANVYKYISENDFYRDFVIEHYSNFLQSELDVRI